MEPPSPFLDARSGSANLVRESTVPSRDPQQVPIRALGQSRGLHPRGSPLAPRGTSSSLLALSACVQRLSTARGRPAKPSSSPRSRCMALPPLSEKRIAHALCSALKINHLRCSWCMMIDLVLVLNTIAAATPRLQPPAEISSDSCQLRQRSDK